MNTMGYTVHQFAVSRAMNDDPLCIDMPSNDGLCCCYFDVSGTGYLAYHVLWHSMVNLDAQ